MKKTLFLPILQALFLFGYCKASGQVITTVAGTLTGPPYHCGPYTGAATNATLGTVTGVAVDALGNLYIAQEGCLTVAKVNPSGIISLFAGSGTRGYSGDGGPAVAAQFNTPWGIAVDNRNGDAIGNVYIADIADYHIRKVNTSGIVTTIAGNGTPNFTAEGTPATTQGVYYPPGVAVDDSGNVFIAASYSNRVYKVTASGTITTLAGGHPGFSGDGGPATAAALNTPWAVLPDASGNVYIADEFNARLRIVKPDGTITTFAGNGTAGNTGDGGPATAAGIGVPRGLALDNCGNLYFTDGRNHVVRKVDAFGIISTVAGTGVPGFSGDNGPATAAQLNEPEGLALDLSGNLYIADGNNGRVRKIAFAIPCTPTKNPSNVITSVNVYPNPAQNMLRIDNVTAPATCAIRDPAGRLMQHCKLKEGSNSISIQSLSPGLYLLELMDIDGNKTVRKIVKD